MKILLVGALGVALTGCNTTFLHSEASPKEGWTYVTGQDNSGPAVWLCPTRGKGECVFVPVTVVE